MRLLLVDDDTTTANSVETTLKSEGYTCDRANLGEDGLQIGKLYDYDMIILELMLPDIDGYEVIRRLRAAKVHTPILILSSLSKPDQKVKGLSSGADDYLTKPFNKNELVARIKAVIRRSRVPAEPVIRIGKLLLNLKTGTVDANNKPLKLTCKEYYVLEMLLLRKGQTLTKETLLNALYGDRDEPVANIIDVFICHLRKKIRTATGGENYIETVRGRGYIMRDPQRMVDNLPDAEFAIAA